MAKKAFRKTTVALMQEAFSTPTMPEFVRMTDIMCQTEQYKRIANHAGERHCIYVLMKVGYMLAVKRMKEAVE